MAAELQLEHTNSDDQLHVRVWDAGGGPTSGRVAQLVAEGWALLALGDPGLDWVQVAVPVSPLPGLARYVGDFPGLPDGVYRHVFHVQADVQPAQGDWAVPGSDRRLDWVGGAPARLWTPAEVAQALGGLGNQPVTLALESDLAQRVPGVLVTIQNVAEDGIPINQRTDVNGEVHLNLFDGEYHVLVQAMPAYQPLPAQLLTVAGETEVVYTLFTTVPGVSYVSPDPDYIMLRTGVRALTERLTDQDFANKLMALRPAAEAKVALRLTEAVFFSTTMTGMQVQAMVDAVACRTAANYLASPGVERATGTHATLALMSADEIARMRRELSAEARELEALVLGGPARLRALLRAYS